MVNFKLLLEKDKMAKPKEKAEDVWEWKPRDDEEEIGGDLNIWNPALDGKEGDELVGEVVELGEGMYGIEAKIYDDSLQDAHGDGITWTTPAHRVLQTALAKLRVGDKVRITYTGDYKTQTGQVAKTYKVARKK